MLSIRRAATAASVTGAALVVFASAASAWTPKASAGPAFCIGNVAYSNVVVTNDEDFPAHVSSSADANYVVGPHASTNFNLLAKGQTITIGFEWADYTVTPPKVLDSATTKVTVPKAAPELCGPAPTTTSVPPATTPPTSPPPATSAPEPTTVPVASSEPTTAATVPAPPVPPAPRHDPTPPKVTVAANMPPASLPSTGSVVGPLVTAGIGALLSGAALVVIVRRRSAA